MHTQKLQIQFLRQYHEKKGLDEIKNQLKICNKICTYAFVVKTLSKLTVFQLYL